MIALSLYLVALFFLGLGNAVVTYHILRYRDPNDISGAVLTTYYGVILIILVGTAILIDWQELLRGNPLFS